MSFIEIAEYLQPKGKEERFFCIPHYLLMHKNFIKLSNRAKVVYAYLLDWSAGRDKFEFSTTVLEKIGVMSRRWTMIALKELEQAGFIKKENNACPSGGFTQEWSFSDEWQEEN